MLDLIAFGAMIREARTRRGWRPIDLALEMGWSGTAPVYRLERAGPDAPRPSPDTVNLLAQVLALDYADRLTLLGFAGHLLDTEPLTSQEEAHVVAWAQPYIARQAEPMMLCDFRYHILAVNDACRRVFGLDQEMVARHRAQGITIVDLIWEPCFGIRALLANFDDLAQSQLLRFQLDNRMRRHESWYREYPARCARYPGFLELWRRTDDLLTHHGMDWDLDQVGIVTIEVRVAGATLRFCPSRRRLHAGYGLVEVAVYAPEDDHTVQWLASTC